MSNPNEIQEQSGKGTGKSSGKAAAGKDSGKIAIDYRGTVGRAMERNGAVRDQKPVQHRLSPIGLYWPENGVSRLRLHPGVNLVDAKLWNTYTKEVNKGEGHPQLMDKIRRGQFRVVESLPEDHEAVEAMISRSIDHEGLRWLADREAAGLNRSEVLTSIADRLAKARPVPIRSGAYQGRVPNLRNANDPQPSLAMG
jgi:hypothetical protein